MTDASSNQALVVSSPIFGREHILRSLTEPSVNLTLVSGDAGIGKSRVLEEVARRPPGNLIVVPPAVVNRYSGSLQMRLLQQLGAALASQPEASLKAKLPGLLDSLVAKTSNFGMQEVLRFVGEQVTSVVRARWGDGAADMFSSVASFAGDETGNYLEKQLANKASPDVVEAFYTFSTDVVELLGPIHLLLDNCGDLNAEDFDLFLDLATNLPPGVYVTAGFTVSNAADAARLTQARVAGARDIPVPPLTVESVASWLKAEATSHADSAAELAASTGGYPLMIQAALTGTVQSSNHLRPGLSCLGRISNSPLGLPRASSPSSRNP